MIISIIMNNAFVRSLSLSVLNCFLIANHGKISGISMAIFSPSLRCQYFFDGSTLFPILLGLSRFESDACSSAIH